jgi:hypothetical protein
MMLRVLAYLWIVAVFVPVAIMVVGMYVALAGNAFN